MMYILAFRLVVIMAILQNVMGMLGREMFTTNAICKSQYCINPVFPGVQDLGRLENNKWVCQNKKSVMQMMNFCKEAIDYDPALPAVASLVQTTSVASIVRAQESAAVTAFAYHLSGMGLEAWDHVRPSDDSNDCIKSVWRMVCYTYFPRAESGCKTGQETKYLRPCRSSCQNYVRECAVECCDESVQCVFSHDVPINKTSLIKTSGYSNFEGPSPYCTGAASSQCASKWLLYVLALLHLLLQTPVGDGSFALPKTWKPGFLAVLVFIACMMQGCDLDRELDMPSHMVGNWQKEPKYLLTYEFIPAEKFPNQAILNSCDSKLASTLQCSGRGVCKAWNPDDAIQDVNFCECFRDWADPECRTPRKSQSYAYALSLFLGWLGADQMYLGFPSFAALKFCTLGGFGAWWLIDIVRIGSAPVYSWNYRVANDLPHWAFVLSLITSLLVVSFLFVGYYTLQQRAKRRRDVLLLQQEEEAQRYLDEIHPRGMKRYGLTSSIGKPSFDHELFAKHE